MEYHLQPKFEGGLRVKNCELFSISLLSKWAWNILYNLEADWSRVLSFKYGDTKSRLLNATWVVNNMKTSLWWRDLRLSVGVCRGKYKKIGHKKSCKLGNNSSIDLWRNKWFSAEYFCTLFPDLFLLFQYSRLKVEDVDSWLNVVCSWYPRHISSLASGLKCNP